MTKISSRTMSRVLTIAAMVPLLAIAACKKADENTATTSTPSVAAPTTPPAGKAWNDVIVPTNEGGLVMGNPAAPVKMVEYGSLSCPHCAKLAQDGDAKIDAYVKSGKLSYEFRSFAIHPQDVPLTVLVRCAPTEASFALIEQVYANFMDMETRSEKGFPAAQAAQKLPKAQQMIAISDALGYTDFFSARGLSVDKQHACLADTAAATKVAKESEAISAKGIESTPTVFINGTKQTTTEWAEIDKALIAAGAQ